VTDLEGRDEEFYIFEELASKFQYDAGMSKESAETKAALIMKERRLNKPELELTK
jgi:hypothetical protein